MKNLVVYFSLDGNTQFVAETIVKEIECDVLKLETKKAYSKGKIGKYLSGGKSVFFKERPELINEDIDLSHYKNIFIGTPVWCGTFAPPLGTFLSSYEIKNKNIFLFACHGGGGAKKCFANFKKALEGNNFMSEISLKEPAKINREEAQKQIRTMISEYRDLLD